MIRRKVIVEIGVREEKTIGGTIETGKEIREWLEVSGRHTPYYGDYKDKLTIIYEEETER